MRFWKSKPVDGDPLVGAAVACYQPGNPHDRRAFALKALLASLGAQTYSRLRVEVTHDGPARTWLPELIAGAAGASLPCALTYSAQRDGSHGHPHRQAAIERLLRQGAEWILLTNDDNYYVPVFLEALLSAGTRKPHPRVVYCDMLHSHRQWKLFTTRPKAGAIDLGCVLAHKEAVEKVRFDDHSFRGDGIWIEKLVRACRGRVAHVPLPLFVHN